MRRRLTLILLILVGCSGDVELPIKTYYFERTIPNIEAVMLIGQTIAEKNEMVFFAANLEEVEKEFDIIFEATEDSWIFRRIGVGKSSGNSFLVSLTPDSMYLAVYDQKDKVALGELLHEWEGQLQAYKIEYTLETQ